MRIKSLISIFFLLLFWEFIGRLNIINNALFPPFTSVITLFMDAHFTYLVISNYVLTLTRALTGFIIGLIAGISLGILVSYRSFHEVIQPIATLLFSVPSVAWVPILIVWVGVKEFELPVLASFLCAFPPIFYGVINSLRVMDRDEVDVAFSLGASPKIVFFRIILPQLLLRVIPQIKTEAVMAWKTVFVTEMVALSSGLGYLALTYATSLDTDKLLAVILLLTLNTLLIIELFEYLEKLLSSKWFGDMRWLR